MLFAPCVVAVVGIVARRMLNTRQQARLEVLEGALIQVQSEHHDGGCRYLCAAPPTPRQPSVMALPRTPPLGLSSKRPSLCAAPITPLFVLVFFVCGTEKTLTKKEKKGKREKESIERGRESFFVFCFCLFLF